MTNEALRKINSMLSDMLPYEYMTWKSDIRFPFFVGEYSEVENLNEDGYLESNFMLTGTTNNSMSELETAKDLIRKVFGEPVTDILPSGSAISVSYAGGMPIPSEDEGIYRLQINLKVQEWRNDNYE